MSVINGATNTAPTPVAGTAVTIEDTATKGDTWNLAAAEILPAAP